jgi:tetratricopeptide (TPR) repeat protein
MRQIVNLPFYAIGVCDTGLLFENLVLYSLAGRGFLWYVLCMYSSHKKALFFAAPFLFVLLSCASGPVDVPVDMPPAKIVQLAQEATDRNRYNQALQYYHVILERYPFDPNNREYLELSMSAEYGIAFLHYKQKKYVESKQEFLALLSRYGPTDTELLPPQFKILSEKVLVRVEEKLIQHPELALQDS